MEAPDFCEPTLGWRVWDIVDQDGALRLRSPAFLTLWLPRREAVALCRRSFPSRRVFGLPEHRAPEERCSCGIYAAREAAQAVPYLSRLFPRRPGVLHRVVGRVSLWGRVVECERGWRGASAYPCALYVPTAARRRLFSFRRLPPPLVPAEEVALGLAEYGVPIELVDCGTRGELLSALDASGRAPPR